MVLDCGQNKYAVYVGNKSLTFWVQVAL